jgi:DNA primase catalytic subunit
LKRLREELFSEDIKMEFDQSMLVLLPQNSNDSKKEEKELKVETEAEEDKEESPQPVSLDGLKDDISSKVKSSEEKVIETLGSLPAEDAAKKIREMTLEEQERLQERLQDAMLDSTAALKNNVKNILDSLQKDNLVLKDTEHAVDQSSNVMRKANADLETRLRKSCANLFTTLTLYLAVIVSFFFMIFFMKLFPKPR